MKTTLEYHLLLLLLFLSRLVLLSASRECPDHFSCGRFSKIGFPFSDTSNPECGLAVMNCSGPDPQIQFSEKGKWYQVDSVNNSDQTILIRDLDVQGHLESNHCNLLHNFTEKVSPFLAINLTAIHPFFKCQRAPPYPISPPFFKSFGKHCCDDYDLYFYLDPQTHLPALPQTLSSRCSVVYSSRLYYTSGSVLRADDNHPLLLFDSDFTINWQVNHLCWECHGNGGQCLGSSEQSFQCANLKGEKVRVKLAIGLSSGVVGCVILTCIVFFLYQRRKKNIFSKKSSNLISRDISDHSLKPDIENGSIHFQTPIFTYKELDEATNHFDTNKEVGDGGFGTVYHGKLRDGRIVAVKRLFEHNYKRVEQFMNEIAILSRLRHQNLVSLYGCTSQHTRELLLVYEYVSNGTVADHIHGERARAGLLTWPIRMSIAIESADALAYLHASETIHRDVKTKNILLDNGFHVKVADFGLSRLFPTDVSHVSTAPQGTPGYVDPEYYQCYQLNDKSDVYSFGVVLVELISSKPAVDIGRHRHEVNLASLAINKIHNRALHELVDPSLGFETDYNTRNMITSVAGLAFRCLQQEKEMRPCMVEVVEVLRGIQSEDYRKTTDEIDDSVNISLLKNIEPLSPVSVTDEWASKSSTPNTSAGGVM